jgi:hypothetical protein
MSKFVFHKNERFHSFESSSTGYYYVVRKSVSYFNVHFFSLLFLHLRGPVARFFFWVGGWGEGEISFRPVFSSVRKRSV